MPILDIEVEESVPPLLSEIVTERGSPSASESVMLLKGFITALSFTGWLLVAPETVGTEFTAVVTTELVAFEIEVLASLSCIVKVVVSL